MGKRCVVQFCGNSNKTGHSMHMSPIDLNLRWQWTKFVQVIIRVDAKCTFWLILEILRPTTHKKP